MTQLSTSFDVDRSVVAATRPYAWPWDGIIDCSKLGLVVVQAPDSPPPATEQLGALPALIESARRAGVRIVQVDTQPPFQHRMARLERTDDLAGPSPLRRSLRPDIVARSSGWNGFFESSLDSKLRQASITHLLITGYWLEIGVHSTMRAANDMGYECLLVEDAVAAFEPSLTVNSLSSIEMSGGIFGAIGNAAAVVEALAAAPQTSTSAPFQLEKQS
jgi:nicotinamidase-related amidase